MGKLRDRLDKQLKTKHKKDAEDCIKIYNKIKEVSDGHVWSSEWNPLVNVSFIGKYPCERRFKPSKVGYIFLKGIQ